jgi:hypothetical protein
MLACRRATGFNRRSTILRSYRRSSSCATWSPHLVYLAHFRRRHAEGRHDASPSAASNACSSRGRGWACCSLASRTRIARERWRSASLAIWTICEAVRPARKRTCSARLLRQMRCARSFALRVEQIRVLEPGVSWSGVAGARPLLRRLRPVRASFTDLTETEPLAISGRCLGMIGDVLLAEQAASASCCRSGARSRVRCGSRRASSPIACVGQMRLPF